MTRILITGGNGFVGENLIKAILKNKQNSKIYVLLRRKPCQSIFFEQMPGDMYIVDFSKIAEIKKVVKDVNPHVIIHLAYSKSRDIVGDGVGTAYFENLQISFNLIESARELRSLSKFIFLGSCDEYGIQNTPYTETLPEHPLTSYGLSKLSITKYLLALYIKEGFPVVVLRPSVIYGVGQGEDMFLPLLAYKVKNNLSFKMTSGTQYRDFIFIDDLVDIIILISFNFDKGLGEIVNVSYGVSHSIKEVAIKFANMIRPNGEVLLNIGAIDYRTAEVMNYFVSNEKATNLFDWHPKTSLDIGLKDIVLSLGKDNE